MQRTASFRIAAVAISVLVAIPLLAFGYSILMGSRSQPSISAIHTSAPLSTPTQVIALQPNSNGAMMRANVHGTGVFVTKGVRQLTGLKWKYKAADRGVNSTPATQGTVVCIGGNSGHLHGVDAVTGEEKWDNPLDNQYTSAPAIAGDKVYVGVWEEFYALSTELGVRRWVFRPEFGTGDGYYSDPVVDDGVVYFGGGHDFYALDSKTGQEIWKLKVSGDVSRVATVYGGTVYVGTYNPGGPTATYLYALDSKTGREKWKRQTTGGGIAGSVAVTDGVVYVGTWDEGLLALDANSGQQKWRYKQRPGERSGVITSPAVAYGTVYITDRGILYAVDAQTGNEKWKYQGVDGFESDPVIADGTVYFAATDVAPWSTLVNGKLLSYLYAVDAQSGQEEWKYSVQGEASSAPAVSDGVVYFGSDEGYLYAIR